MTQNNYQRYFFPILSRLDAESAHNLTISLLKQAQNWPPGETFLRKIAGHVPEKPVSLLGLQFPNILGVAAGFDKDVLVTKGLALLGFGHIEVGTITPRPQPGNARPRIFRLVEDQALINRMGFPSAGVNEVIPRLQKRSQGERPFILGISLGKQKETPLEEAVNDYIAVLKSVAAYADYLAINISSPNTPELRKLQGARYLNSLLETLSQENKTAAENHGFNPKPLLIKIAPDLTWPELDEVLAAALDQQIAGIIATNTTLSRPNLVNKHKNESGGLSGRPLSARSSEVISYIIRETNGRLPVIGVGGLFTADDVQATIDAGASLVQLYTALVYEGPGIAGQILRQLED